MSDIAQLMQMMQADPGLGAPVPGAPLSDAAPMDPMMALPPTAPPIGPGMGAVGAFPSTDPTALAQVVQDALANLAEQDHHMLEMQQQQAAMSAQPIIDQMMMQASMPQPEPMEMGAPDPMMAFGEGGLPPLPPEGLVA